MTSTVDERRRARVGDGPPSRAQEALRPERTDLSIKMHSVADSGHPRAAELREKADAFDDATAAPAENTEADTAITKRMLGCWARARRVFEECAQPASTDLGG